MNKDKKLVFGILALLVSIVAVSISYAAFTQSLNINGTANVTASNWSVHFANLTNGVRSGTASEVVAPTIKASRTDIGDYSVKFFTPGDSITYTFDVVNDGDYDAKISVLTKGTPTCNGTDPTSNTNVCANLEYTLTYTNNGATVSQNDPLRKDQTRNMTLVLKYKSTINQNELPSAEVTVSNLGITIQYAQSSLYDGVNTEVPLITYVNRQNSGQITSGDEISIDTEHFYVVRSDSTNTVLLAKYNLLVGEVFETSDGSTWTHTKTLSSNDAGYGLQNENAKGSYSGGTDRTGVVAFSGQAYWDGDECISTNKGSINCPGTGGLKAAYANSSNPEGKTGTYSLPCPNAYNSSLSNIAPSYTISGASYYAQNNGYTIAYYVEEYVRTLKNLGAPNTITGGLLTYGDVNLLSTAIRFSTSYWYGYVGDYYSVYGISSGESSGIMPFAARERGVRPIIIIQTSDMPN